MFSALDENNLYTTHEREWSQGLASRFSKPKRARPAHQRWPPDDSSPSTHVVLCQRPSSVEGRFLITSCERDLGERNARPVGRVRRGQRVMVGWDEHSRRPERPGPEGQARSWPPRPQPTRESCQHERWDARPHRRAARPRVDVGILPMRQLVAFAPWEIQRTDLDSERVRGILAHLKRTGRSCWGMRRRHCANFFNENRRVIMPGIVRTSSDSTRRRTAE